MNTTNVVTEVVEDSAIVGGVIVSLQDIQSVLSICLLLFNILWLLGKFTIKFFRYIKNDGKLSEEEKADLKNDAEVIDNLVDKVGDKDANK